jgi:glycosyltransferase involved in cell wall biosynthesis
MFVEVDILIIAASKNEELIKTTQKAIDTCGKRFNIYVIETHKYHKYKGAKVLKYIEKSFNYNGCINYGLSQTSSPIVGVFNNDVEFKKDWFRHLKHALKEFDSVSPRCEYSNKFTHGIIEGYELRKHLNGWAIVFNRSIVNKIGGFDESVSFWRSDDLYAEQIKAKGIKHALVCESVVNHLGSKTYKTLDKQTQQKYTYDEYDRFKDQHFSGVEFSIIMPSYLGEYDKAAANREQKIIRAIKSVQNQSFDNWELIIVADGCNKTVEIVKPYLSDKIRCFKIPKQPKFSGNVRQIGIDRAIGKYIIYLDNDDCYGKDHLKKVHYRMGTNDWVYYDDIYYNGKHDQSFKRVQLELGLVGTSSICHKRLLKVSWKDCDGYGHDYTFVEKLKEHTNYEHIGESEYLICHVPGEYDYNGNS